MTWFVVNCHQEYPSAVIHTDQTTDVIFQHFDPSESLTSLLDNHFHKEYFVKDAKKIYTEGNDRIWKSAETADWWNFIQVSNIFYPLNFLS